MLTVYSKNETVFTHNGLGIILPTKCLITEELNGMFELTLEHPFDSRGKWENLIEGNIIKAPTSRGNQLFRIYRVNKKLNSVVVDARHIFYDLIDNFIEGVEINEQNGQNAINAILSNTQYAHNFTGESDITMTNSALVEYTNPIQALLSDAENSFVNKWGGEIERDNFTIRMKTRLGADNGVTIRYKKNLVGLEVDIDESEVVTRVMPTAMDGEYILELPEKYIDSPKIGEYPAPKIRHYHYTDLNTEEYYEEEIFDILRERVQTLYNVDRIDEPTVTAKVSFVLLSKTDQYKDYAILEDINLGDTVRVIHEPLKVDYETRVVKTVWNALAKKYDSIELGSIQKNITGTIARTETSISYLTQNKASYADLFVVNQKVINLDAVTVKTNDFEAQVARINFIENNYITSDEAYLNFLKSTDAELIYAKITDLNVIVGNFNVLNGKVGNIEILLSGNLTAANMQTNFITADSGLIANGAILDAMIYNVSANKINTGTLYTNLVNIMSQSGNLTLMDNTIQIKDNSRVRVQIGKDASNDYNIYIWDSLGNLMFDATGLKADGIKSAIIRDDMVSETADISGSKLNINSVFTEMNNSSSTLKSSRIYLDDIAQTLDVAFLSLSDDVQSQGTALSVVQGQIEAKIWQQDIDYTLQPRYETYPLPCTSIPIDGVGTFAIEGKTEYVEGEGFINVKGQIVSRGKNWFDLDNVAITNYAATGTKISNGINVKAPLSSAWRSVYCEIAGLKPNQQYTVKADVTIRSGLAIISPRTSTNALISSTLEGNINNNYTAKFISQPDGIVRLFFLCAGAEAVDGDVDYTNIQLELGDTATTYETYKTPFSSEEIELKGLPNGVKDEVRDGKLIKKISDVYTLQSDDIFVVVNQSNITIAITNAPFKADFPTGDEYAVTGKIIIPSKEETYLTARDNISNIGKWYLTASRRLDFILPLGTTLTQAREQLAGIKIIYQLATPTETPFDDKINVYANGSVTFEPTGLMPDVASIEIPTSLGAVASQMVTKSAEIEVNLDGITQTVQSIESDLSGLDGRVTNAEGSISILAGQISLKADASVVDGLSSQLSQALIDIDALESEIVLKVTQTEVDAALDSANLYTDGQISLLSDSMILEFNKIGLGGAQSGITKVDADGIEVTHSEIDAMTRLSADGLRIFDMTDPENPVQIGGLMAIGGRVQNVAGAIVSPDHDDFYMTIGESLYDEIYIPSLKVYDKRYNDEEAFLNMYYVNDGGTIPEYVSYFTSNKQLKLRSFEGNFNNYSELSLMDDSIAFNLIKNNTPGSKIYAGFHSILHSVVGYDVYMRIAKEAVDGEHKLGIVYDITDEAYPYYADDANYYKLWHEGNLLYYSGTFTPYFYFTSGSVTYSAQTGYYTVMGDICYFTIYLKIASASYPASNESSLAIKGLPVASANVTNLYTSVSITSFAYGMPPGYTQLYGWIRPNTQEIRLIAWKNDGTYINPAKETYYLETNDEFIITGFYKKA